MGCNLLDFDIGCLLAGIVEAIYAGLSAGFQQVFDYMITGTMPETGSDVVFFGKPTGSTWEVVWRATWIGSGEAWLLALSFVLIIVGAQLRAVLSIGGFGQMSKQQRNRRIGKSTLLLTAWYPIMVTWLTLVEGLARLFAPSQAGFEAMLKGMFSTSGIGSQVRAFAAGGIFLAIGVAVIALFVIVALIFLIIVKFLIAFYAFVIPLAIAFWAWNVPYLSDKAKEYAMHFIPLSFIPAALAIFTRFFTVAVSEDFIISGGILKTIAAPIVYSVVSFVIIWKLLSAGAPWAAKAAKVGAGLALAGGLAYAGAGRYAVASAARGSLAKGATRGVLSTQYGPEATIQGDVGRRQHGKVSPGGAVKSP